MTISVFACAGAPAAYAANFACAWNDGTANWTTTADWSGCNSTFPNNVGGNTYDATVSSGDPTLTTAITIGSVTINGPGQWDLAGSSASATLTGTLTNTGTIDLFGNTSNSANQANLAVNGAASNAGIVNIRTAGNLSVTGAGNAYGQTAGTTNIFSGGTLTAPNVNVNGGTLQGNGTTAGNLNVSSAGTVKAVVPNTNNPATLTVNGNYDQSSGTLATLLQGTGAGQVGTVSVGPGTVNLQGGTLQANFVSPLTPAAGQTFSNVMTFAPGSLNGLFTALQNGNGGLSPNPTYLNRQRSDPRGELQQLRGQCAAAGRKHAGHDCRELERRHRQLEHRLGLEQRRFPDVLLRRRYRPDG
jgi:hypothetical protein